MANAANLQPARERRLRPCVGCVMIYLGWFDAPSAASDTVEQKFDCKRLAQGLFLFDTALTRSKLYHAVKWSLPDDTPLLVAPLSDAPKFKGMEAGALNWLRERLD